jgi:predicted DsbA family dithiol-disulfide isomerase
MSKQRIRIEIWSDVACPWCYIGERRFFRALDARPDRDSFEVVFRPFELDPTAPATAEPLRARLERRYGARAAAMTAQAGAAAAVEGITADWEHARAARTRDAHRLLWLAAREDGEAVQRRLAELLFSAQFERGGDVSSVEELVALAAAAGMNTGRASALLAGDEGNREVEADLAHAHRLGIRSVPTFLFDGRFAISGAQPASTFTAVLDELSHQAEAAPEVAPGGTSQGECDEGQCEVSLGATESIAELGIGRIVRQREVATEERS